jgi:hypothetical protein
MERRYEVRLRELLDEAVVSPEQLRGLLERLESFVEGSGVFRGIIQHEQADHGAFLIEHCGRACPHRTRHGEECYFGRFAACLVRTKQRELAQQYVAGLVSQVERKNVESIAYHHDQDRQALEKFVC